MRQAAEAEIKRLEALYEEMVPQSAARLDADLALFKANPETQLLMRYEAQAERELHRAVNSFLKLRKDPDLVAPPEPEPEPAPEPAPEPVAAAPKKARKSSTPPAQTNPAPGALRAARRPPAPRNAPEMPCFGSP